MQAQIDGRRVRIFFPSGEDMAFVEMLKLAGNVNKIELDNGDIWELLPFKVWATEWEQNPDAAQNTSRENDVWAVWAFPEYGSVIHTEWADEAAAVAFCEALKPMRGLKSMQIENAKQGIEKSLRKIDEWVWTKVS